MSSSNKMLETGVLYTGQVVAADVDSGQVDVMLDTLGLRLTRVQCALGIHSAMVGLRTRWVPGVGTQVLVLRGKQYPYVVGTLPSSVSYPHDQGDQLTIKGDLADRTKLGAFEKRTLQYRGDGAGAVDMVEGEWSVQSAMGCGMDYLVGLARLTGGDLARVEACVSNDMIRVISDRYVNLSSFGDFKIYRDGNRLNVRWNGTSYDHEAWGCSTPDDQKVAISSDDKTTPGDIDSSKKQSPADTGRWRFSMFVGHLGDFLNLFYHDPARTLGDMAEKTINPFASGKTRINVGPQGEFLLQSVDSIALERVVRIVVPSERKTEEDPTGDHGPDWETFTKDPLKVWDYNGQDMSVACYQLRNQARWLAQFHTMARFWQSSEEGKDWKMPTNESEIPEPKTSGDEADRTDLESTKFVEVYSTIRIMTDGSIVIWDSNGSSVTMSRGDVRISASKNMYFSAAGCVHFEAGQDINLHARRNVELVALKGGITLTAWAWLSAFCQKGTLWLRSDATPDDNNKYADDDSVENPAQRVHDKKGVLIEAGRARVGVQGKGAVHVKADKPDGDPDKLDGVHVFSGNDVTINASGNFLTRVLGFVSLKGLKDAFFGGDRTVLQGRVIGLGRATVVRQTGIETPSLVARKVSGNTVASSSGRINPIPTPDPEELYVPKPLGERTPEEASDSFGDVPIVSAADLASAASADRLDAVTQLNGGASPGYAGPTQAVGVDDWYQSLSEQFVAGNEDLTDKYGYYDPAQRLAMIGASSAAYPAPGMAVTKHWVALGGAGRMDKPSIVIKDNQAPRLQLMTRQLRYIKTAELAKPIIPRTR